MAIRMTIDKLAEMANDALRARIARMRTNTVRELLIDNDREQFMDLDHNEAVDLICEWSVNGRKGRKDQTRIELLADLDTEIGYRQEESRT
jgi:hypothetical protein